MYYIKSNLLEFGDIILMKSDDEVSRRVRSQSNSQFSHVMLYLGSFAYADSTDNGVHVSHIQRFMFESSLDVKVLRLKDDSLKKNLTEITNFARQKMGTEYSVREAFESIRSESQVAKLPNRQFCTRFVSQAYQSCGIELTINVDYPVPEDLLNSNKLVEVANISNLASSKDIEYLESESYLDAQSKIRNNLFKQIREISGQDIQTTDQLRILIIDNPEFDEQITKLYRESDLVTLMNEGYGKVPHLYNLDTFIEFYGDEISIIDAAKRILKIERPLNEDLKGTFSSLTELNEKYPRKFFAFDLEVIKLSKSKRDLILKIATQVWNKYADEEFSKSNL